MGETRIFEAEHWLFIPYRDPRHVCGFAADFNDVMGCYGKRGKESEQKLDCSIYSQ